MKLNHKFEKLILLTFLLSVIAVLAEKLILEDVILIDVNQDLNWYLYDDNRSGGGTVTDSLLITDRFQWQCELKKGSINYPYCGLQIELGAEFSRRR